MMIHDTTGQKNKLEWTFQIWNLKHRKVRWTYRLQECWDPSAERPVYVCTYMFIVYRSILLYILLLSGIYMFVFHFPKSAKFSSTNWNEFHFSKMKRFDVPSFFVIQSSVMFWNDHRIGCISSQAAACFVSTGSNEVIICAWKCNGVVMIHLLCL